MSVLYIIAGFNHFSNSQFYERIMPLYFPLHIQIVMVTGILEIIFGALLLFEYTRKSAARLIIFMLIAFLPVHIQMIIDNYAAADKIFWLAIIRLPIQFVLIYWAYKISKVKLDKITTSPN